MKTHRHPGIAALVLLLGGVSLMTAGCASRARPQSPFRERLERLEATGGSLAALDGCFWSPAEGCFLSKGQAIRRMAASRVLYVGERHDRYEHHLLQANVLKWLAERGHLLCVGLEMVQRPFQEPLDRYIGGELDLPTLLEEVEYYDRWRFDHRLYRAIFEWCRLTDTPLLALNAPRESSRTVYRQGLEAVPEELRPYVPESIPPGPPAHLEFVKEVFQSHMSGGEWDEEAFQRFYLAQCLWDETMAQSAAERLRRDPAGERKLVILAGAGHVERGWGIPHRLEREVPHEGLIILPVTIPDPVKAQSEWPLIEQAEDETLADLLYFMLPRELPAAPRLGIRLGPGASGEATVSEVASGSLAESMGMQVGDTILRVGEHVLTSTSAVRYALELAGESTEPLSVVVRRGSLELRLSPSPGEGEDGN